MNEHGRLLLLQDHLTKIVDQMDFKELALFQMKDFCDGGPESFEQFTQKNEERQASLLFPTATRIVAGLESVETITDLIRESLLKKNGLVDD